MMSDDEAAGLWQEVTGGLVPEGFYGFIQELRSRASAATVAEPSPDAINEARHHFDETTARLLKEKTGFVAEVGKIGQPLMDRLTEEKAAHIMQRDGYAITGYVLAKPDGQRCVVEQSAVRWLTKDEAWNLMHPSEDAQQAEPGADERPIAYMRVGTTPWHGYEACAADDPNGFPVYRAAQSGQRAGVTESKTSLNEMVSRFLCWRLPSDFQPDAGIHFKPVNHPNAWPTGTNLFTADQAKAMFAHVLGVEEIAAAPTQQQEDPDA